MVRFLWAFNSLQMTGKERFLMFSFVSAQDRIRNDRLCEFPVIDFVIDVGGKEELGSKTGACILTDHKRRG